MSDPKGCAELEMDARADFSIDSDDEIARLLSAMPFAGAHLGGGLCKQAAERILYLSAQESLLEEWQQRAQRAEAALAEIERPLDAQMARLNEQVVRLNDRAFAMTVENSILQRERDALQQENKLLREMVDMVMAIPNMTDAQLEQLKANCRIAMQKPVDQPTGAVSPHAGAHEGHEDATK